jgi:predicted nuclease of predicted toxin-antitoxin system
MSKASDDEILEYARKQGYSIVTLDADFHFLLAHSGAVSPSVIRVRIEGLKAGPFASLLSDIMARHGADLKEGVALSVGPTRLALHRLPF